MQLESALTASPWIFVLIAAWVGDKDLAIEQLRLVNKISGGVDYGHLKLDPLWDPLHGDPRFEEIVASLAPAGSK